jgi:UDP-2,3-diacylglucosamine hydrolase
VSEPRTLFVSDVHANPRERGTLDAFLTFLRGPAVGARALYVLGDLFETFLHRDDAARPGYRDVLEGLAALATAGTEVHYQAGNRDFPVEDVLRPLGIARLRDTAIVEVDGLRVLVTHGDLLCSRDRRYQAFRRVVRGRPLRTLSETLPAAALDAVAGGARAASKAETARKAYDDMGLDAGRIRRLLLRTDADALVCGHVHWGRAFRPEVEGRVRPVFVLGAWEDGANWLERTGQRWRFLHS